MVRSLLKRLKGKILLSSDAMGERPPSDSRTRARALVQGLQNEICAGLEQLDGGAHFQEESWDRPEGGAVSYTHLTLPTNREV